MGSAALAVVLSVVIAGGLLLTANVALSGRSVDGETRVAPSRTDARSRVVSPRPTEASQPRQPPTAQPSPDHAWAETAPVAVEPPPARLHIPAISVTTDLVELGLDPDGGLQVPADFAKAGWYVGAPRPGAVGPAVIAGHVDSRTGPAVFYRLGELRPGDEVEVVRVDDSTIRFVVDRVDQHPKNAFPTASVYGDTDEPTLRLITCGGDFDGSTRSYRDNIVVYATLR
jgi:sortase (surface protein transpeptidase)